MGLRLAGPGARARARGGGRQGLVSAWRAARELRPEEGQAAGQAQRGHGAAASAWPGRHSPRTQLPGGERGERAQVWAVGSLAPRGRSESWGLRVSTQPGPRNRHTDMGHGGTEPTSGRFGFAVGRDPGQQV